MPPLLDRLNHDSAKCNVEWRGVGLHEERGARTTRAVTAGEELFYSYGCKGNAELILGYGFAVWGNPHELARICMDLEKFVRPEDPRFDRVHCSFEEALDRIVGQAEFCRRDESKAIFNVSVEDIADSCKSVRNPWTALCNICTAMYLLLGKGSPEDLLAELLSQASASVVKPQRPDEWEAFWKATRAKDSVQVSDGASCACSIVGMATALRHAQLTVVQTAMQKLAAMGPLPRGRKASGRGRGRRQRPGRGGAAGVESVSDAPLESGS